MRVLFMVSLGMAFYFGSIQSSVAQSNTLSPFQTDGCTNWFDGYPKSPYLWRSCCTVHDKLYWLGGTKEQRSTADKELRACVSQRGGKWMGEYMYFFVSLGGSPYFNSSYRWGYGWKYKEDGHARGYKIPTPAEQQQIDALLPAADQVLLKDAAQYPSVFHK